MAWLTRHSKAQTQDAEATSEGSHASVMRADPYSFQVAHRRLAWSFRASVVVNVFLAFTVNSMANVVSIAWPLKEVQLGLLRADPADDRVYRIEPIAKDVDGFNLLMEAAARRYVRNLLTIDTVTQTERFKEAFRMTDDVFYKRFSEERFDKVEEAINSGLNRSIVIESVDRIENTDGTYKYAVDFVQVDELKGEVIERRKLRAYLNMTTRPNQVSEADKYENPLGITVLDLVLKERGNS